MLHEAECAAIIEQYAEPSHFVLPGLLNEGRRFDLAFVDGNHRFDSVFVDLYYLGRLVKPGGMIILDDYDLPGIRKATAFFATNLNWTIEEATPEWAALRTATTPNERHFTYFADF